MSEKMKILVVECKWALGSTKMGPTPVQITLYPALHYMRLAQVLT